MGMLDLFHNWAGISNCRNDRFVLKFALFDDFAFFGILCLPKYSCVSLYKCPDHLENLNMKVLFIIY